MNTGSTIQPTIKDVVEQLRHQLAGLFEVVSVEVAQTPADAVRFWGRLLQESETAFAEMQRRFELVGYTPNLARGDKGSGLDVVTAIRGVIDPQPSRAWINVLLFVLTLLTTFSAGYLIAEGQVLEAFSFAFTLLLILGTHEFAHYFAARWHRAAVTLPYFIPMIPGLSLFGTLGAVIQMRSPIRDRKQLFDVGASGPLAGLLMAIPLLIIGIILSPVEPMVSGEGYLMEGNSLLYLGLKYVIKGQIVPGGGLDISLHPIAFAGWAGLLITFLNLLPIGQLDGGHVLYAMLGRRAWPIAGLTALLLLGMGRLWSGWFLWFFLSLLFGLRHPPPLNDHTSLDSRRRLLGVLMIVVFVLTFVPVPLRLVS